MVTVRKITLIENEPPQFDGQWTVGEVLQMADGLARWVQLLAVSPPIQQPPEAAKENEGKYGR